MIKCTKHIQYNELIFVGKCSLCKSEFEAERQDLKIEYHHNEECIIGAKCTECDRGTILWTKIPKPRDD